MDDHAVNRQAVLYICSTPIGNLSDTSQRLLDTLAEVDVVLCEDTRHTRKLLTHFDIHPPKLMSYHLHNERDRTVEFERLWSDNLRVALVSDAGTPLLSDPGEMLVEAAIARGVQVVPVPGPSALLAGLVGSGLPLTPFLYLGFPPRTKGTREAWMRDFEQVPATFVMYESPHRVASLVAFLLECLGDRNAVVARELTKRYETFERGTLSELAIRLAEREPKGEYVVIVDNRRPPAPPEEAENRMEDAVALVQQRIAEGVRHKEAVTEAATQFDVQRRELYNATLRRNE